jgi:hypothetical protein
MEVSLRQLKLSHARRTAVNMESHVAVRNLLMAARTRSMEDVPRRFKIHPPNDLPKYDLT